MSKKTRRRSVPKVAAALDPVIAEFGLSLTIPQASVLSNLPTRRIRDLIAGGQLSFQRQGKKHLIKRGDLVAYLESNWQRNGV